MNYHTKLYFIEYKFESLVKEINYINIISDNLNNIFNILKIISNICDNK